MSRIGNTAIQTGTNPHDWGTRPVSATRRHIFVRVLRRTNRVTSVPSVEPTAPSPFQSVGERTAANIRAELARRKLSGRDLARACGWPTTTTWRRINGDIPLNVDEVAAAAEFFRIPVAELMGVTDPVPTAIASARTG